MQIHRILGILLTLLENDKVTAPQLAEKFEVSRRTINRDLDQILMARIPIITTQGYDGGISLEKGYAIDKTLFTIDEIQAIFAGLGSIESVSKDNQWSYLIDKLSLNKNSTFQDHDKIRIDLSSHYKDTLTSKIAFIKQAIEMKKCISFDYYAKEQESHRVIEACLLVYTYSNWYVFGYCLTRKDFRYFKLNRLWHLAMSDIACENRSMPSVDLHFDDFYTDEVKLVARFFKSVKYRLIEEYGIDSFCEDEQGLLFEASFNSVETLLSWVLSFGDAVAVLEPQEVRGHLKRIASNMNELYEEHDK